MRFIRIWRKKNGRNTVFTTSINLIDKFFQTGRIRIPGERLKGFNLRGISYSCSVRCVCSIFLNTLKQATESQILKEPQINYFINEHKSFGLCYYLCRGIKWGQLNNLSISVYFMYNKIRIPESNSIESALTTHCWIIF